MEAPLAIYGDVVGKGVGVSPDHEAIASDMSFSYRRIVEDPILVRSDPDTAAYVDLLWDCSHGYVVEPMPSVSVQAYTVLLPPTIVARRAQSHAALASNCSMLAVRVAKTAVVTAAGCRLPTDDSAAPPSPRVASCTLGYGGAALGKIGGYAVSG